MYPRKNKNDMNKISILVKVSGPAYMSWLVGDHCNTTSAAATNAGLEVSAIHYLNSVPDENRSPRRWGWKNPKTLYYLDWLLALYPNMLFVHVLRNPLDMASVQWQHLSHRALEFSGIHGGFDEASAVMTDRCAAMTASSFSGVPILGTNTDAVTAKSLARMSECSAGSEDDCAQRSAQPSAEPWRCLEMMLWAEINTGTTNLLLSTRSALCFHG
jgi:hypothetical protein